MWAFEASPLPPLMASDFEAKYNVDNDDDDDASYDNDGNANFTDEMST